MQEYMLILYDDMMINEDMMARGYANVCDDMMTLL